MASAAAAAPTSIWRRGAHEASLVRLYVLRALALFVAIEGFFTKLPYLTDPDPASRGIIACLLAGLWLSAFLVLRYPLRMMPIFLFEIIWKTLWLIDYGLPQWLGGPGSPRLSKDLFEIGMFPFVIALFVPWGHIWRLYVRQPAERDAGDVSPARLKLVRAAFLLSAIAGCLLVLPGILGPDPALRGMQESMIAGLWMCAFLGLRYPLQMLPILLFELASATLWLAAYGLPRWLPGAATPQTLSDLLAIGGVAILFGLIMPWGHVWRRYVRQPAERWKRDSHFHAR
jgi:hypothetical protein